MKPIPLRELRLLGEAKRFQINQPLAQLPSLGPVKGWLELHHKGVALEVNGAASTQVELCCDRCLNSFSYQLKAKANELIAITASASVAPETELIGSLDAAVESLHPEADFDWEHWLFEQLSLQLPLKRLCDANCIGIMPPEVIPEAATVLLDPRWAALEALTKQP